MRTLFALLTLLLPLVVFGQGTKATRFTTNTDAAATAIIRSLVPVNVGTATNSVGVAVNNLAPKASPTFTGVVTTPGLRISGNFDSLSDPVGRSSFAGGSNNFNALVTGFYNFAGGADNFMAITNGTANFASGAANFASLLHGSHSIAFGTDNFRDVVETDIVNTEIGPTTDCQFAAGFGNFRYLTNGIWNAGINSENFWSLQHGIANFGAGYCNFYYTLSGSNNFGAGFQNYFFSTNGSFNVGIGQYNFQHMGLGNANFGAGLNNMWQLRSGSRNLTFGENNGYDMLAGSDNFMFGSENFRVLTNGSGNIAGPSNAAFNVQSGNYNTFIGPNTAVSNAAKSVSYSTVFGRGASVAGNDMFIIGAVTNRVGINTNNPQAELHVDGSALVETNLSVGTTATAPIARFTISGSAAATQGDSAIALNDSSTGNSRNWSIGNASGSYGDLSFFVSAANGGNPFLGTQVLLMGKTGDSTFGGSVSVPALAYNATTWNGNLTVPTRDDIRDKIESMSSGGGTNRFYEPGEVNHYIVLGGNTNAFGVTADGSSWLAQMDFGGNFLTANATVNGNINWPAKAGGGAQQWVFADNAGVLSAATGIAVTSLAVGGGTTISSVLSATATLNFGSILAASSADLTITVTGAAVNDVVQLGPPAGLETSVNALGIVTATDTVTVRLFNVGTIAVDPASATWRATVTHY